MIKSATFTANSSPPKSTDKCPPQSVVWLNRLLLLGIGGGLAWFLGVVAATYYPNKNPEMPSAIALQERPKTGNQATAPAGGALQTQQLAQEVQQLQTQMELLRDRTKALESTLGNPPSTEPLEKRLSAIAQQLQEAPQTDAPPAGNDQGELDGNSQSQPETDTLKVTLPSDILFKDSSNVLSPEARLILDKVIGDLNNYKKATIVVAAHTDNAGQVEDNRELSFQRATAIEQYLSRNLGKQYRWVVIGYGATRPTVPNDTDVNRQRNRRIELSLSVE